MLKETVEQALNSYLNEVSKLGLIERVSMGEDPTTSSIHFFNFFTHEIDIKREVIDTELTHLGAVLQRALEPEVTTRVSYVLPSQVNRFRDECTSRGIELSEISLKPSE